jgi:hypothetical protein
MKARLRTLIALAGMMSVGQAVEARDVGVNVVRPGTTDVLKARIVAGGWVTIAVSGDGDTDLDLYVYDPNGRLVGHDDGPTDDCGVRFYASYTAKYTVKVVNRSSFFSNKYVIVVN